jgi:alkylhydroperoxidase family enzyme
MDPLFLHEVEHDPKPGPWRQAIELSRRRGGEYPQIWHLFAYRPEVTDHLARFTQEVLRGPSPLSPGLRELIAAYTSSRNQCPF